MQKAQSAMEYLITYGWAIIIIGITLAALYALGLFNPAAFTSNECIFPGDFGCLSGFLYANGTLAINFEQATISAINVTAVGCNTAGLPTNMTAPQPPSNAPIYLPIGGNFSLTTQCRANGTIFTSQPGTLYRGYLVVNYTSLQSGFQHVLVGKLIEKSS